MSYTHSLAIDSAMCTTVSSNTRLGHAPASIQPLLGTDRCPMLLPSENFIHSDHTFVFRIEANFQGQVFTVSNLACKHYRPSREVSI